MFLFDCLKFVLQLKHSLPAKIFHLPKLSRLNVTRINIEIALLKYVASLNQGK